MGGAFTPKPTIEEKIKEIDYKATNDEIEAVAAAMVRDAMLSDEPIAVQEGVGWAVINYSLTYGADVTLVFERGLTMVPVGFVRKQKGWFGFEYRSRVWYVRDREATGTMWNNAMRRANQLLTKKSGTPTLADPNLILATHYIRKESLLKHARTYFSEHS